MSDADLAWECFLVTATLGVILAVVGCFLNRDIERQEDDVVSMPACQRLKFIFTEICKGLTVRELYGTFLYFMIMGTIPQFKEYMYYFQINEVGFDNTEYAYLQVFAFIGILFGSLIYKGAATYLEIRSMVVLACVINTLGSLG